MYMYIYIFFTFFNYYNYCYFLSIKINMFERYFNDFLKLHPAYATFVGINKYNSELENGFSKKYEEDYKKLAKKYLAKLDRIKRKNIYHHSLKYDIDMTLGSFKLNFDYLSISPHHFIIIDLINSTTEGFLPLKTNKNLKDLIQRYKKSVEITKDQIKKLNDGIKKGITVPKIIVKTVIDELDEFTKNKNIFKLPVDENKFNKELVKDYNETIENIIKPQVLLFKNYIQNNYLPFATNTIGLSKIPTGKKMYEYLVKSHTTLDTLKIKDIHDLGLKEVARIKKEMNKIKNEVGFKGNLDSFKKFLNDDKQFYFKNGNDIIKDYKNWKKIIDKTVMPNYFDFEVSMDYNIKKMPSHIAKNGPGAYYYLPSSFKKRRGTFFVNTYNLKGSPKYTAESLALHEGNPGHNFQIVRSIDVKVPNFIIYDGSTAYSEGWGLYSESLGEYKNKYSKFGRLMNEMMRAVRLVVDTGIHYYGWTFDRTVEYFQKNTGLSYFESKNEIIRYISDPGQALAYKIGEKFIFNLRYKFIKSKKGNIKDFHRYLLDIGPVPLKFIKL